MFDLKIKLSFFILIFVLLTFISVNASEVEIIIPEKATTVYAGQLSEIQILIKNIGNTKDTFYYSIYPTYWVSLSKYWDSLDAGEVTSLFMTIETPKDVEEGIIVFKINVRSVDTNYSKYQDVYFDLKRLTNVYISDLRIDKESLNPEEKLTIQPVITSIEKAYPVDVFITTKIMKNNSAIQIFDDLIKMKPKSSETLSHEFYIKMSYAPGDYNIVFTLKDKFNKTLDERTIDFKIKPFHKVDKYKETKNSLLYSSVTIIVTNNGNTPEHNVYVSESLPEISSKFFYPEIEPESEEIKDNRVVYQWVINELNPGETQTIKYQLRFVNVVIIAVILLAVIVWIIWLLFRPKLTKSYMGLFGKEEEMTISLQVKNKGRKMVDKVIVKDFVPAIAQVVAKFATLTPVLKRKTNGTELIWIIKQLKPKDERVITYKIKPVIDVVGEFKLPKAHLMYETKRGRKYRILSKTVTVTGKIK
jgi:hypothetical protein